MIDGRTNNRMDAIRRRIKGLKGGITACIVSILCIVAQASKVNALEVVTTATPTGRSWSKGGVSCSYLGQSGNPGLSYCPGVWNNSQLGKITTTNTIPAIKNNLYVGYVQIRSQNNKPALLWSYGTSNDWIFENIKEISATELETKFDLTESGNSITGNGESLAYATYYEVILRAKNNGNFLWQFGSGDAILWQNNSTGGTIIINLLEEIAEYEVANQNKIEDAVNNPEYIQQEKNDLEDAKSDATDSGDAISSAITSKQSLLDLGYTLITTLGEAESDCNLPFLDNTTINLCQGGDSEIMIAMKSLLSLGVGFLAYEAGKAWYHRFVNLINEVSR